MTGLFDPENAPAARLLVDKLDRLVGMLYVFKFRQIVDFSANQGHAPRPGASHTDSRLLPFTAG